MGAVNIPHSLLHINGGQQTVGQPEKPRITQCFDDLQAAIERVGHNVDRLVERTEPVLRQVPGVPTADGQDVGVHVSDMASALIRRIQHLDAISRNLATVIDRIEL